MPWKDRETVQNEKLVEMAKKEVSKGSNVTTLTENPLDEITYGYLFSDVKIGLSTATKQVIAAVFSKVLNQIGLGIPRSKLIGTIMHYLQVDQNTADMLLNMAFKVIEDDISTEIKYSLTLAKQRRLQIYNSAMGVMDYRTALASLQDLSRLNNDYMQNKAGVDKLKMLINALENVAVVDGEDELIESGSEIYEEED